jgi:V8-like Glu-specific endopeptidase
MRDLNSMHALRALALVAIVASFVAPLGATAEEKPATSSDVLSLDELKAQLDAEVKKSSVDQDDEIIERLMREAIARGGSKPIYGPDDRTDWASINDPKVKRRAAASIALFHATNLSPTSAGRLKLTAKSLGESFALCPNERFAKQLTGADCSGVLVAPNVVVTAGHCVREVAQSRDAPALSDIRFVFGYVARDMHDPGRSEYDKQQVFRGKRLIGGKLFPASQGNDDWAVIELDRAVPNDLAQPVRIAGGRIADNEDVYVIGYPSGLPLKYAPGAKVRKNGSRAYFVANLDTFGGNSGSGVFASKTNELVGILVRGDADYYVDSDNGCRRPFFCPSSGCEGEDVTRIEAVELPSSVMVRPAQ